MSLVSMSNIVKWVLIRIELIELIESIESHAILERFLHTLIQAKHPP